MGRHEAYTSEIADIILEKIATSTDGIRTICSDEDLPAASTVMKWIAENKEGFTERYACAKEAQADLMADEMLAIADDTTGDVIMVRNAAGELVEAENREFINRSRLRVDTRKWIASKLKPKRYGDRVTQEVVGKDGGPIQITGMEIISYKKQE